MSNAAPRRPWFTTRERTRVGAWCQAPNPCPDRLHTDSVELTPVMDPEDRELLWGLVRRHARATLSKHAEALLEGWDDAVEHFWKVVSAVDSKGTARSHPLLGVRPAA